MKIRELFDTLELIENSVDQIIDEIRAYNMNNVGTELHELTIDDHIDKLEMAHMLFIGIALIEQRGQQTHDDQLPQIKDPVISAAIFATLKIEAILKCRTKIKQI
ncbi:hypothetical protein LLH06_07870 [Mucilaginibacter daejeonensis]|uniref:hypothetical protein n=1 Tax=Mucilaginibacter daejeonensis TaxID=398049 RepID=UPI001D1701A6|nr:hypothetical protein [Mucilaginibacter daejeonensis]UEG54880.1 hypothetical protein LLH06_07870 [Mucilaginibacter daejeonensis]